MPRRITVPDEHVALVLPAQLADELMALCNIIRRAGKTLRLTNGNGDLDLGRSGIKSICGDVMLALLDAREA